MIKEIKWSSKSHDLPDLHLDFKNNKGDAANTVIFIGENGSKKTTVLNNISRFLDSVSMDDVSLVKYVLDGKEHILSSQEKKEYMSNSEENMSETYYVPDGELDYYTERNRLPYDDIRNMTYIFSQAGAGFSTHEVTVITDEENEENSTSYADVKQCFVDLYQKAMVDAFNVMRKDNSFNFAEFFKSTELGRLQNAIDYIFKGKIKFDRTERIYDNTYAVCFTKDGNEIALENLSSGEQQIIFRGMNILKQELITQDNLRFVFIDEPELSLHPRWEKRILQFYRKLFTDNRSGKQTAQIFIATHSERIVEEAVNNPEDIKVIILDKKKDGHVIQKSMNRRALNAITGAEVNYLAFGTYSKDYFLHLFGELHMHLLSENPRCNIKNVDNFLRAHHLFENDLIRNDDVRDYSTLPVYIRNAIDHPESGRTYTYEELVKATEFLRDVYIDEKNSQQ